MPQSISGHSNNTGEVAHGDAVLHFLALICTFNPVTGLSKLCGCEAKPPPLADMGIPLAFTIFNGVVVMMVVVVVVVLLRPPLPPTPPPPLPLPFSFSPFNGDSSNSSFDLRFSGLVGKKVVGEVLGVTPFPLPPIVVVVVVALPTIAP